MATNRITGLASGMDYESIIEKLIEANRAPLTKLEKNETKVEWQREALLEINSKFLSFRTSALDMKLQGTYLSYSAESSDKNYISANASSDAQEGTYKVSVSSLATKSTLTGMKLPQTITSNSIINNADRNALAGKSFDITYNGETKTISFAEDETFGNINDVVNSLQSKINDAFGTNQIQVTRSGAGKIAISSDISKDLPEDEYTSLGLPLMITSGKEGSDALENLHITSGSSTVFDSSKTLGEFLSDTSFDAEGKMTLGINGKEFSFTKEQTISDVFSTLNKDVDADITIKYSDVKKCMILSRDSYGEGRQLEISGGGGTDGEFWKKLKLDYYNYTSNNDVFVDAGGSYEGGKNALFTITSPDGETAKNVMSASNTFTYNGVSMTFLEADSTKTTTITVSKNVDEVYDKIKSFTDAYNDLLGTLNKYYKEDKSSYEPLTDEEREALSEKQEEDWEKLAKKGILRRDSTLGDAINQMRSAVTSIVSNSTISSLFEIGISTSAYDSVNSENNGKLTIDEAKLKEALKNDLEGVANLFASSPKQIQGSKLENTNINLDGTSFDVTYGGLTRTINLSGQYDLSDAESRTKFEDYMKEIFAKEFGDDKVSVSVSGDRILFSSLKTVNMTFNVSSEGAADSTKNALSIFGVSDGAKYDINERGFATKIYDICTTSMNSIIDKAGSSSTKVDASTLGKQMERLQESIKKQKERLEMLEDRYYSQFAAMEDAISKMNSQSSSIMNLLSGGQ